MIEIYFYSTIIFFCGMTLGFYLKTRNKIPQWIQTYMIEFSSQQRTNLNQKYDDFTKSHATILQDLRLISNAHKIQIEELEKEFNLISIRTTTIDKKVSEASKTVNVNFTGKIPVQTSVEPYIREAKKKKPKNVG